MTEPTTASRRGRRPRPAPYVTISTDGPLDGLVTITATGSEDRVIVEAAWGVPHLRSTVTAERVGHAAADELAQA